MFLRVHSKEKGSTTSRFRRSSYAHESGKERERERVEKEAEREKERVQKEAERERVEKEAETEWERVEKEAERERERVDKEAERESREGGKEGRAREMCKTRSKQASPHMYKRLTHLHGYTGLRWVQPTAGKHCLVQHL